MTAQCRALNVSASGYHQYRARQVGDAGPLQVGRRIGDTASLVHIKAIFHETKGAYGWPRIWRELPARGVRAGKERVRKLMKVHGLQARGKRKFKFKATTNSSHRLPVSPNLLERNFCAAEPCLDGRHHLSVDGRRLGLSRGRHRSVQPCGRRLRDERAHDEDIGRRRLAHGLVP